MSEQAAEITTPLEYENEHLRNALAQVNDDLVRTRIALKFQGEVIDALRVAVEQGPGAHTHDDGEAPHEP